MSSIISISTPSPDPAQTKRADRTITRSPGSESPVAGTSLPVSSKAAKPEPVRVDFERLAENLQKFARSLNRDLNFSVHEASGRTVVRVLDGETKEVIRQIPSDEVLRMLEALAEQRGALLDVEV